MRKKAYVILLLVLVVAIWLISDFVSQRTIDELKGGFSKVGYIRNENNIGTARLVYTVSVADTTQAEYLECGNRLPHHPRNGVTTVYFFATPGLTPSLLTIDPPHFDTSIYRPVAVYQKNKAGKPSVTLQ